MKSKNILVLRRNLKNAFTSTALGGSIILALLIAWEILANSGLVNPLFSSSPSRVIHTGIKILKDGSLFFHILASGKIFVMGYVLAATIGIPLGIFLGWFKPASRAFGPLIAALYTTPRIALMPLFIIWFGLGIGSKLALVFLSAVFPLIVNMQTAMSTIDDEFTRVAQVYGANRLQTFLTIALPVSVPFLLTGLRLATGRALLGIVGAEVFGGAEGVGYLIQYAGATFQTDIVFVCVFVIATFGIIMDRALLALNKHFDSWRGADA